MKVTAHQPVLLFVGELYFFKYIFAFCKNLGKLYGIFFCLDKDQVSIFADTKLQLKKIEHSLQAYIQLSDFKLRLEPMT